MSIALVHEVWPKREDFSLVYCDAAWRMWLWARYARLEMALLIASESHGIRVADWVLYEPPGGVKLFIEKPRSRLRRRHVRARTSMQWLRWQFKLPKSCSRSPKKVDDQEQPGSPP